MYQLPWLDTTGNFPVKSVYMIFFILLMLMHISLDLGHGAWTMCLSSFLSFSCVDHMPCLCCCMCPFCVSSYSRMNFVTAFAVGMGHVAKTSMFIALSHIAYVGILLLHGNTVLLSLCLGVHTCC